ncbi:MAG TPA: hypothetical protein VK867_05225 [Candidatus Limnocylindrales bacterium]|nr:hypothetical protein [Candidatus Limnocylindrales bacterium]
MPRGRLTALVILATVVLGACATGTTPSVGSTQAPTPDSTPPSAPTDSAPTGVELTGVPMACVNLGLDECRRILAETGELVPAGIAPTYIQVGPFGCVEGGGCPRSLAARPQGDVTIEAARGAVSYHITAAAGGGRLTIERQDASLMAIEPQSQPPVTPGPRPFTLGHCGLWSGIDVGGSWWDPIGVVDGDHPDAINSAEGTLAILDQARATFTSDGGLTVQLVRCDGPKGLPGCM